MSKATQLTTEPKFLVLDQYSFLSVTLPERNVFANNHHHHNNKKQFILKNICLRECVGRDGEWGRTVVVMHRFSRINKYNHVGCTLHNSQGHRILGLKVNGVTCCCSTWWLISWVPSTSNNFVIW